MMAGALLPQPTPKVLWCSQCFVSPDCSGTIRLPPASISADPDDGLSASCKDRVKTAACIIGPIRSDALDTFSGRDLSQQVGQQRAVAFMARGEFDRTDVVGRGIYGQYEEDQKTVRA